MGYKFLSDGRKVAVVGPINSTEFIVQEIFITADGDEIPSGEKFTTKTLHEKPVESYFVREERNRKERLSKLDAEINKLNLDIKDKSQKLKAKAAMLANSPEIKDLFGDQAELVSMFMTGTIEYIVVDNYELKAPQKMEDLIIDWEGWNDDRRFDSLKLVSVLGKSEGKLAYNINRYYDGSGGSHEVYPFASYEDAVNKIKELAIKKINGNYFSVDERSLCKELGIIFDDETNKKITDILTKRIRESITSYQKSIKESQKKQREYEKQLEAIED